jgi:hypothetical protein
LSHSILSASLAQAQYGPRTKIGKNYQQWSETTSTNGIDPSFCNGNTTCYVLFQRTPQGQQLIVQHVACRVFVSAGGPRNTWLGTRKGQTIVNRRTPLVPVAMTDTVAGNNWAINSPVMHLAEANERPHVRFFNSEAANWSVDCSISGKLR